MFARCCVAAAGMLSLCFPLAVAAAAVPPAQATVACANMQPQIDLASFGRTIRVQHPRILRYIGPRYPNWLHGQSIHRLVVVCVLVDKFGRPSNATVVYHSGYPALDNAALHAARITGFRAGTVNGMPQVMSTQLDYQFDVK